MKRFLSSAMTAAFVLSAGGAHADTLSVTSYDMPNGSGQAHGGSYNYWDKSYTGGGSTTTDGALLKGGVGDLTDGVTTTSNWYGIENAAGTGPYVGWLNGVTANPTIDFRFGTVVVVDTVRIHADDSGGAGGVSLPSTVTINGAAFAVTDPDPGSTAPSWLEFKGLGITGNHVTVSLGYGNSWIFVDEVQFAGVVPEPETYAMMLAGLGLLGAVARRRRQR